MGRADILNFFEKNPGAFFSREEISKSIGLNKQTVNSVLKKLKERGEVEYKEIVPKQGPAKLMYCFRVVDDFLQEVDNDYHYLKNQKEYRMWLHEHILGIIMARELKILNKRVKHLEEMGEEKRK